MSRGGGGGKGLGEDLVLEKVIRETGSLLWTKEKPGDAKKEIIEAFIQRNPALLVEAYNHREEDHSPGARRNGCCCGAAGGQARKCVALSL
jgi:hypothetical protein